MASLRLGGSNLIKRYAEDDADDCASQHVVHDYAPAVGEFLNSVDGPGFPDVKKAEERKGGEGPEAPVWDFCYGDEGGLAGAGEFHKGEDAEEADGDGDDFIKHNAGGIFFAEDAFGVFADVGGDGDEQNASSEVSPEIAGPEEQRGEGETSECAGGAGGFGHSTEPSALSDPEEQAVHIFTYPLYKDRDCSKDSARRKWR